MQIFNLRGIYITCESDISTISLHVRPIFFLDISEASRISLNDLDTPSGRHAIYSSMLPLSHL